MSIEEKLRQFGAFSDPAATAPATSQPAAAEQVARPVAQPDPSVQRRPQVEESPTMVLPTVPDHQPTPAPSHQAPAQEWTARPAAVGTDEVPRERPVESGPITIATSGVEGSTRTRDLAEVGFLGWCNRTLHTRFARTQIELFRDRCRVEANITLSPMKVAGVLSGNGSVGKSSITQLIGDALCVLRSEKGGICGVDIDESSALARRMRPSSAETSTRRAVSTFAHDARDGKVDNSAKVSSYMVTNEEGFSVLPGVSFAGDAELSAQDLYTVLDTLYDYEKLVLLDFPGAREVATSKVARGWLDAGIMVVELNETSITSAAHMLQQIQFNNPDLLARLVVVLNYRESPTVLPDIEAARDKFAGLLNTTHRDDRIFVLRSDPHVRESGPIEWKKLRQETRDAAFGIAAALMRIMPLEGEPNFRRNAR